MNDHFENDFELTKQERLQNFFTGLETDESTIADIPRLERDLFRIELNNRLKVWPAWLNRSDLLEALKNDVSCRLDFEDNDDDSQWKNE